LHFQAGGFLADYAAMQQPPTIIAGSTIESSVDAQVQRNPATAATTHWQVDKKLEQSSDGPVEVGGRDGPEPTRFGDWEKAGRCIDF